jgi:hypothetical protein
MMLEALAAPFRNNKALIIAGLTAFAVYGLGGGLVGCAAAAVAKPAIKRARKMPAVQGVLETISEQPEIRKWTRKIKSDVQPYLDKLLAKYLEAKPPAVSVLAIRKSLARENSGRAQPRTAA